MKYIVHDRVVRSRLPEGPLVAHIDSFAEWADQQGYVSCSVYRRVLLGACFSQWLGKKGVRLQDVSSEHPSRYLRYRARQVRIGRGDAAALRQLIAFLRCAGHIPEEKIPRRQPTPSEKCAEAFQRYLREDRALSSATVINYLPFIRSFLNDCFGNGPAKLSQLRADDVVHFVERQAARLHRKRAKLMTAAMRSFLLVSDQGGEPAVMTRLEAPQQTGHRYPHFLPDGQHFLFYSSGSRGGRGVYLGAVNGSQIRRLLDADAASVYSLGHLLFVRQGTLFAQRFDPVRLETAGNQFLVSEDIPFDGAFDRTAMSASAMGPLAYRSGAAAGSEHQLIWFDRSGKEVGRIGKPDTSDLFGVELSPDGRRVAVSRTLNGNSDIWLVETERGLLSRFTFDADNDSNPIWSADGRSIAFTSNRKGQFNIYQKAATGAGVEEAVFTAQESKSPTDWSPDGRFILYRNLDPKSNYDLWAVPVDGDRKPFAVVQTGSDEREGQFSPDGKWIAYESNETGRYEIYVQPFPGPGGKWQITNDGGAQVRWRRDGKEIFYIGLDGRLMAAPIRRNSSANSVEHETPAPLFRRT